MTKALDGLARRSMFAPRVLTVDELRAMTEQQDDKGPRTKRPKTDVRKLVAAMDAVPTGAGVQVKVRLQPDLLGILDARRGDMPRADFIRELIQNA